MKRPTIDGLRVIGGLISTHRHSKNDVKPRGVNPSSNCFSAVMCAVAPSFGVVGPCPLLGVYLCAFAQLTKGQHMKPNKNSVRVMLTDEAIQRLKTASDRSGTNLSTTVEQAIRATFKSNTKAIMGKGNMNDRTEQ
jgi:hypothetical protein